MITALALLLLLTLLVSTEPEAGDQSRNNREESSP
jgi:hypothetical protein